MLPANIILLNAAQVSLPLFPPALLQHSLSMNARFPASIKAEAILKLICVLAEPSCE